MSIATRELEMHWTIISPFLVIRDERDYDLTIKRMNHLLDEVGTDEEHPMYDLLDTIGTVIHAYEERHYPMPECSGSEMLHFFMDEYDLKQSDLPEVGSQGVVSEILGGKRELNIRQIRALAERFHVSPAVFV